MLPTRGRRQAFRKWRKGARITAWDERSHHADISSFVPPLGSFGASETLIIALPMLANCPNIHRVLCLSKIGKKKFSNLSPKTAKRCKDPPQNRGFREKAARMCLPERLNLDHRLFVRGPKLGLEDPFFNRQLSNMQSYAVSAVQAPVLP